MNYDELDMATAEKLAELWHKGWSVTAAAVNLGLLDSTVSKYYALWDMAKKGGNRQRRRPGPSPKGPMPADDR